MTNPYMKFQNPSMHGSEVMLWIKKRNGQMDGWMHARTIVPEAICPSNFFKVGGIKKGHNLAKILWMITNIELDLYFTN